MDKIDCHSDKLYKINKLMLIWLPIKRVNLIKFKINKKKLWPSNKSTMLFSNILRLQFLVVQKYVIKRWRTEMSIVQFIQFVKLRKSYSCQDISYFKHKFNILLNWQCSHEVQLNVTSDWFKFHCNLCVFTFCKYTTRITSKWNDKII